MGKFVLTAELKLQAPGNINSVVNQINSRLKDIQINFKLQNASKAVSGLNEVSKAADRTAASVDKMGYAFGVSLKRFAAFSVASRAIGLFSNRLSGAIDDAINFQDQMVRLAQITGKTTGELKGVSDQIGELASSLGVTSKNILSVTDILAQAGLKAKDLEVAIRALAKTELAPTFGRIEDTAEGAVAIIAQFGEGVGALERQLGSINRVAADFAVESEDLISAVRRTGGIFKASGGNLEELLALFTSVRATTRESAESIATGLRTIFTRIQRPQTIEYLKQFEVQLTDLNGKFVGPYQAIQQLSEALSQFGEGDIRFIAIAEELGGYRQIGKVIPLVRQFAVAEQARQVAVEGGASLDKDAATAQESLRRQFIRTQEAFLKLIRDIGETSSFQLMIKIGLDLANAFIKVADSIKPIIPLIGALAAFKFAQGIGGFARGVGAGFRQIVGPQTKNAGGLIHRFASGGFVPGSGNRDTVPAMLTPGEFVIRKSSVNKIGAGRLAAMNENRYAKGGIIALNPPNETVPEKTEDITRDQVIAKSGSSNIPIARFKDIAKSTGNKELIELSNKEKLSVTAYGFSIGDKTVSDATESEIKDKFANLINTSGGKLAEKLNVTSRRQISSSDLELFGINGVIGNAFEALLASFGAPFDIPPQDEQQKAFNKANNNSAFDFPSGLGSLAISAGLNELANIPTDAKRTLTSKTLKELIEVKYVNLLADAFRSKVLLEKGKEFDKQLSAVKSGQQFSGLDSLKIFGIKSSADAKAQGFIKKGSLIWEKLNTGGIAKKPLVDDILENAIGAILPNPKNIQEVIKAGGAALDVDRTLIRTVGDTAYAKAPTAAAKQQVLQRYFRGSARLQDLKSSPITQFGRALQSAIKNGQINPNNLKIISKSQRAPGVAEYLNQLFGVPFGNMIFTQGGGKQSALDAFNTKGSRAQRVAKRATGGPAPSDTVPALLTPGEFVFSKGAAQRIGYGNLNRMNKQGVAGFARGGSVGVQKFAQGSSGKGVSPINSVLKSEVDQFKQIFNKLVSEGATFAQAFQIAEKEMKKLAATSKLFKRYLSEQKQRIIDLPSGASKQQRTEKTSKPTSENDQKAEKDANASFVKFAAFTGAINTVGVSLANLGKNADGTSTAFSRIVEASLGVVNQVSAVIFALQQFGVSLNVKGLKEFFGSGKGSFGDKLTGGRFGGQSKGPGFISKVIGGAIKNTGAALNRIPGVSKATSFIGGAAKTTGSAAISNIGGVLAKVAGPLVAIGGSAVLVSGAFNSIISSVYDFDNQLKQAIETGNAEKASEIAGQKSDLEAANTTRALGAGIGATLGALGGPIGSALGAVAGAAIGTALANYAPEWTQIINEFFGGDTQKSAKARANADALASKYTLEHAANLKEADAAIKQLEAGVISTEQAMQIVGRNALNAANAFSAQQQAVSESQANKSTGFQANLRNFFSGGGTFFENATQRNTRIDKENAAASKQSFGALSTEFEGLLSGPIAQRMFAGGNSADQVMAEMAKMNPKIFAAMNQAANSSDAALSEMGKQALETAKRNAEASAKQAENQRKFLETLNLGLYGVISGAQAAASALESIGMQGEGVDPLTKSMKVLEAATTSQAVAMDPKQIDAATQEYANSLRKSGLAEPQVQKNIAALQATTQAQAGLGSSLELARSTLQASAQGGNPEEIKKAIIEAATAGITDPGQKSTIAARLGAVEFNDQIISQLSLGDISGILKASSEKLSEATKEQIETGNLLAKNNQALAAMVMKRIDAEKQAADAANEAVDVGLDMAKIREQFGGAKVTIGQQRQASAQRTANILRGTGISGGAGTPQDLARAGAQIQEELLGLERSKAAGTFTDVDKQRETTLLQAASGVTEQKKRELELAKESAEVTKKKVSMEKSAFEKLLGGDVMGAIEDMMASAAGAALRSGDSGLAGAFGGRANLAALKNLEETGASAEQKQAAARAAGASFGIGPRLADAFAGTTAEERTANQSVISATTAIEQGAQENAALAAARAETASAFEQQARDAINRPQGPISFGGTVPAPSPVPAPLQSDKTAPRAAGAPTGATGGAGGGVGGGAAAGAPRPTGPGMPTAGAGISPEVVNMFSSSVNNFVAAVDKLQNLKLSVQVDATNVNVNLNGGTFLNTLSTEVRNSVLDTVANEIPKYKVGIDGKLSKGGIVG